MTGARAVIHGAIIAAVNMVAAYGCYYLARSPYWYLFWLPLLTMLVFNVCWDVSVRRRQ